MIHSVTFNFGPGDAVRLKETPALTGVVRELHSDRRGLRSYCVRPVNKDGQQTTTWYDEDELEDVPTTMKPAAIVPSGKPSAGATSH